MKPRAVLKPHSNSYPFEERTVDLNGAIKVGRAVAKCKAQSDNAIFDCKVLSRNHALIWFETGKFFLKDTCSSNGTYVNNTRLSVPNSESPSQEIHSNDILQFGVEVVDNTNKMTHSCIIVRIKLFYPNGSEASRQGTMFTIPTINMLPPYYSYTQMIEREQRIYQKLNEIEDVLAAAHPIADMLVNAKMQIDNLQTECDLKTNDAKILQGKIDKYEQQETLHLEDIRKMKSMIKEKSIELEEMRGQMNRVIRQDHRLMTTSLVLLLIVLVIGGFDMIVMFTRLMV